MPLRRGRGQLVDVGEDRLRQPSEDLLPEVRGAGGLGDTPPGHPGADAVGGQKRFERTPRARLATADPDVDLEPGGPIAFGPLDHVHETGKGLLDAGADPRAERT